MASHAAGCRATPAEQVLRSGGLLSRVLVRRCVGSRTRSFVCQCGQMTTPAFVSSLGLYFSFPAETGHPTPVGASGPLALHKGQRGSALAEAQIEPPSPVFHALGLCVQGRARVFYCVAMCDAR